MIITICGSMQFSEQMLEVKKKLEQQGHQTIVPSTTNQYVGKSAEEKTKLTLYEKNEKDAIKDHWEKIKVSDAILVLNYDKKGISNYIGGNTMLEIGFAHVLNKKIFLLNPIPEIEFYKSEIIAVKPIVINGKLENINLF